MSAPTILIVEDDDDARRLYRSALSMAGFRVVEAQDGLPALRRIDDSPPDLVVLDLGLPTVSGLTVLAEVTAQPETRRTKILIVTGSTEQLDHLDVACILRKPVSPERLVEAVTDCLGSGARGVES